MKLWDKPEALRVFAVVQFSPRGKCGIVMTHSAKHSAKIAMGRLVLGNRDKTRYKIVEFAPLWGQIWDGEHRTEKPKSPALPEKP